LDDPYGDLIVELPVTLEDGPVFGVVVEVKLEDDPVDRLEHRTAPLSRGAGRAS
jgi:hypothetical protein